MILLWVVELNHNSFSRNYEEWKKSEESIEYWDTLEEVKRIIKRKKKKKKKIRAKGRPAADQIIMDRSKKLSLRKS